MLTGGIMRECLLSKYFTVFGHRWSVLVSLFLDLDIGVVGLLAYIDTNTVIYKSKA
jgi:hypothetical protein